MSIRVILVDDHPVVRAGLRSVVDAPEHIAVIGEADSGEGALAIVDELDPDVVLCDLRLGEGIDGIEVTKRLRALPNPPAVLILTTFDLDSEIVAALNAGASGYLLKDIDPGDISIAIEKAAKGGTYLPPEISSKAIAAMRNPGPKLTRREREVVKLLATGASNAQIAQELFVTEATVKSHLVNVFTKLGVDSRARAIRVAEDRGPGLSPRLVQDTPGPRRRPGVSSLNVGRNRTLTRKHRSLPDTSELRKYPMATYICGSIPFGGACEDYPWSETRRAAAYHQGMSRRIPS
jgi:DNA-binding NarL/FixJ family response regulator